MTRRRQVPTVKVRLKEKELGALAFLKRLPDFTNSTPNEILKACLMIVAVDTKLKMLEEANNENTSE
jgi:hypothetical protein